MNHTAEPWKLMPAGLDDCGMAQCFDYVQVAPKRQITCEGLSYDEANANAARIVACVNAMVGIDDPVEVMRQVRKLVDYRRRVKPLQFQLEKADDHFGYLKEMVPK